MGVGTHIGSFLSYSVVMTVIEVCAKHYGNTET